jgi:hypothetical protein
MHRTQIYLTEEQEQSLAARAADAGVSKAEVVRRLLDIALGLQTGAEQRRRAILATSGLLEEAPDWPEWLAAVRSSSANERLERLERQ